MLLTTSDSQFKWQIFNPGSQREKFVYIKELIITPISIKLSYQHTLLWKSEDDLLGKFIKTSFMKAIGTFEDAPVMLKGIKLEGLWDKWGDISQKILSKYKAQAAQIILSAVFSQRILGNPIQLFGGIAKGFQDLVEKPKEGFAEGPLAGGQGIAKGLGSLGSKSIGGSFGAVKHITGSIADGLAKLAGVIRVC